MRLDGLAGNRRPVLTFREQPILHSNDLNDSGLRRQPEGHVAASCLLCPHGPAVSLNSPVG